MEIPGSPQSVLLQREAYITWFTLEGVEDPHWLGMDTSNTGKEVEWDKSLIQTPQSYALRAEPLGSESRTGAEQGCLVGALHGQEARLPFYQWDRLRLPWTQLPTGRGDPNSSGVRARTFPLVS